MESFLQSIADLWRPHPGQRDFLLRPEKTKVLACGRRWGKTEVCAVGIAEAILRGPPSQHFIVAPTLDQARILFERTCDFLEQIGSRFQAELAKLKPRFSPYPKLELGEHTVIARSGHVPRSLRGHEATHIVVDEAAYLPDEVVQDVLWPMLATHDGHLTMISTPRGFNGFWRYFQMGQRRENGLWSGQAPTRENPNIRPQFLQTQRELISERAYAVEYEATFVEATGAVFREEAIAQAVQPLLTEPPRGPFYVGIDWAKGRDFSALVVLSGTRSQCTVVEAYRQGRLSYPLMAATFLETIRRYPGAMVTCDSTGVGDSQNDWTLEHFGYPIRGYQFTSESKSRLINRLVELFEMGTIRLPPDPVLIRELQSFVTKTAPSGAIRYEAAGSEHDDMVVALALAAYELPLGTGDRIRSA